MDLRYYEALTANLSMATLAALEWSFLSDGLGLRASQSAEEYGAVLEGLQSLAAVAVSRETARAKIAARAAARKSPGGIFAPAEDLLERRVTHEQLISLINSPRYMAMLTDNRRQRREQVHRYAAARQQQRQRPPDAPPPPPEAPPPPLAEHAAPPMGMEHGMEHGGMELYTAPCEAVLEVPVSLSDERASGAPSCPRRGGSVSHAATPTAQRKERPHSRASLSGWGLGVSAFGRRRRRDAGSEEPSADR